MSTRNYCELSGKKLTAASKWFWPSGNWTLSIKTGHKVFFIIIIIIIIIIIVVVTIIIIIIIIILKSFLVVGHWKIVAKCYSYCIFDCSIISKENSVGDRRGHCDVVFCLLYEWF